VIELNYESMAGYDNILPKVEVEALRERALIALNSIVEILDRRRAAGFVRRCHGDLHLQNICVLEGEPTLFDCIEFSDNLACIDVLYDLAFLLMDLWHRGHAADANLIFNRYFDMSDRAHEGLAALPCSCRCAQRCARMSQQRPPRGNVTRQSRVSNGKLRATTSTMPQSFWTFNFHR
jgi:aminoglycoside phosphotransferase family enzyme